MKRRAWLVSAVALLALAAWLMWRGEGKAKPPPVAHVDFPRYARPEESLRNERRRTLPPAPAKANEEGYHRKRDPMLTALPTAKGKSAVVFEAAALKSSPIGQLWRDCMLGRYELERLDSFKQRYGVDLLEDVDRFAISSEKVALVSGDFSGAKLDGLGQKHHTYGDKGVIYEAGEDGERPFAIWGDGMAMLARDPKELEAAIDRLEDRAPAAEPPIPDWAAYGDVYGVLSAEEFAAMLPESEQEIAGRLRSALEHVELHVDASDEVAIVADGVGPVGDDVDDLGRTLGAALSLGRLKAQSDGDEKLAELLELAKVSPHGGRFSVEMALPVPLLQRQMGRCRKGDAGP